MTISDDSVRMQTCEHLELDIETIDSTQVKEFLDQDQDNDEGIID